MNDERIQALLSAAIDGELAPAEREALDRLLQEDPQARQMHSDLHRIDSLLKELPDLEAPESLHGRILQSVRLPSVKKQQPKSGWLEGFTPFAVLRYGVATAAGLLLAVTFYESRPGFGEMPDLTELAGTMAPNRDRSAAQVLDSHAFRARGLESQVLLERRNGGLLLDIRIDGDRPVEVLVDFAAAGARLDAIAQSEDAPPDFIDIGPDRLRMLASGRGQLTVLFHRAGDHAVRGTNKFELEFSSDGRLLQRGSLAAAW